MKVTACYAKRNSSASLTTSTSPALVTSNNVTSNGDNAKSSVTSKAWIISLFTVIAVFLSIAAIFIICRKMDKSLCKIGNSDANEPADMNESDSLSEDFEDAHSSPISNKQINSVVTTAYHVECQESMNLAMNKDTSEKDPFLGNKTEDTSERSPIMRQQYDTITGARKSGNSDANDLVDINESDNLSQHYEDAFSSPTSNKQINSEVSTENTDEGQKEKSAKTASGSGFDSVTSDNEEDKDKKESNCVFDDTFESLERKTPQTDAEGHEELYSLLNGGTLTKQVMAAVIKKTTGKTVKELSDDKNVQKKVQNLLQEGNTHISYTNEWKDSIHVLYALLRIFLDEKYHPKSGWGNPVKDEDIGIGNDIDRLYRIFTITEKIPRYNIVSVENYNRLLDIMIKTCTRLDSHVDGQCKEYIKAFTSECRSTSLTEKMNNIKEYISTYFFGND